MNVYVVLSNHGIHHDCMAIFKAKEKAEVFLNNNEIYKGYIKPIEVIGDYKYPNDVYEANAYLGEWKVHTFIGLYASPTEAEAAAGENGTVIPRSLENS
jgi:hypothetical protein